MLCVDINIWFLLFLNIYSLTTLTIRSFHTSFTVRVWILLLLLNGITLFSQKSLYVAHFIQKVYTLLVYFAASTHNLDEFINMDPTKGLGQVMNLTQLVKTFYQQPQSVGSCEMSAFCHSEVLFTRLCKSRCRWHCWLLLYVKT